MTSLTRKALDTLLLHMVRSPAVFAQASTRILPECFDDGVEIGHKLIWRATLEFHKDFKVLPSREYLATKISQYVEGVPMLSDPNIYNAVQWQVANLFTDMADKDILPEAALKLLDTFNFERNARSKIVNLLSTGAASPELLNAELRRHRTITNVKVVEPFADDADVSTTIIPRVLTGVNFIDTATNGGIRPGELIGFLAPSGGGKTTLSNQLAIATALNKRHVFVFTYEEPPTPEYLIPVRACAARIDRNIIERAGNINNLPPAELERYNKIRPEINRYLHFVDMSGAMSTGQGFGGPTEIAAILRQYADEGIKADAFIVDWFWPMMMRWMAQAPSVAGRKNVEMRNIGQETVDMLHQVAGEFNCWGWVNQQLAPADAQKKGKHEHQAAAEFKSFSWYLNGCFTLNMLDETKSTGTLNYSKARTAKRGSQEIKLLGEFATFELQSEDMTYDPLQKKSIKKVEYNKVPTERTRSKTDDNYTAVD